MTEPRSAMSKSNFILELLAAWVVTLSAVAIGLLSLASHELRTDDRTMPRWYQRPIGDAEEWNEDLSAPRGAGWVLPQYGSSTAPDPAEK
jgi:hypothetical protein